MKELAIVETRIILEPADQARAFKYATVRLVDRPAPGTTPVVVEMMRGEAVEVSTAAQAASLASLFHRVAELLEEHERSLALKDAAGAL